MSRIAAGQAKLGHSLKSLREKWEIAQEHWKDAVRQEFEERHLKELESRVRAALTAMDRLSETLSRAERECR